LDRPHPVDAAHQQITPQDFIEHSIVENISSDHHHVYSWFNAPNQNTRQNCDIRIPLAEHVLAPILELP